MSPPRLYSSLAVSGRSARGRSKRMAFAAAIAIALAAGCAREAPPAAPATVRPVMTQTVGAQSLSSALRLPAEVRPRIETRYGFRVAGKIAERRVSVGDTVRAGQLLARLDSQDARPAIDAAQAALSAARTEQRLATSELERINELKGKGFVSQGQLDRQQASLDSARARAAQAQAQLENARNAARFQSLQADAQGVVTAVDAEAGQVVAAGQVVIRVAPTRDYELLVDVPEAELAAARSAGKWQVRLTALPQQVFEARLRELSPVADAATRTYPMRLSLIGPVDGIALGMSAVVEAQAHQRSGIVLPLSALVARDGSPWVWLVDAESRVRRVAVQAGEMRNDGILIASGLNDGDKVVVAGANLLDEGQAVRLMDGAQ